MNFYTLKKNKQYLFVVICFGFSLLTTFDLSAQKYKLKANRLLKQAKEFIRVEEYHHAKVDLKDAFKLDPENIDINYYLGIAYLHSFERKKSLAHFLEVIDSYYNFPKLNFYTARAYHYNHKFDEAIEYYNRHRKSIKSKNSEISNNDIDVLIEQCLNGKLMMEHAADVEIFNLGNKINTDKTEFAPTITADETMLIFTSRREDSFGDIDPLTNESYEDIYVSKKDQNGEWGEAINIGTSINTDTHDASISLSSDGLKLFLYKDNKSSSSLLSGDLYYSDFKNGSWEIPKKMQDGINSDGLESHASISADGNMLFITSNREKGGQGGMDIYTVRRLPDLTWAEPKNMGPKINTPYDEEGPFIDPEGLTLYFSSKGHNSMGGFDMFSSKFDTEAGEWLAPVNLGYPINTADDDLFYVWSADGTRGYFSSSRDDSYGEQDLYMVSYPKHSLKIIVLKGKVTDIETKKPLASIIEVIDNNTHEVIIVSSSNSFNGQYSLFLQPNKNYGIRIKCAGYLFKSLNLDVHNQFDFLELKENIELKLIRDKEFEELNNIFFAENTDLKIESEPELKAVKEFLELDDLNEYKIEFAIHSGEEEDSVLSVFKTKALAEVLGQEIQNLDLASDRFITKSYGFGSKYPIATNLTNTGRLFNKRIEYILRKKTPLYKGISYADDLKINIYNSENDIIDFPCPTIESNNSLDLEALILFRSNDNTITSQAEETIKMLTEILERCPNAKLEIKGHTDNQGHESYNVKLSNKRASLIAQQLAYRGIDKNRLIIMAFGSSLPIFSNDSLVTRRKNNRVDFKFFLGDILTLNFEEEVSSKPKNDSIDTTFDDEIILVKNDTIDKRRKEDLVVKEKLDISQINKMLSKYSIYFGFDSNNLTETAKITLNKVIKYFKTHPEYKFEIAGYTDNIGSIKYNIALGKRRATSVLQYFIKNINNKQFEVKSYGIDKQVVSNDPEINRKKSRSVRFKFIEQ